MANKATLIDPTGKEKPVEVEVGSQTAQQYFGRGFKLMGADGKPVPQADPALGQTNFNYGGAVLNSYVGPETLPTTSLTIPKTPGSGIIATSEPVVKDETATKDLVASLSVPTVSQKSAQEASDAYIQLLKDQQTSLENSRSGQIDTINSSFNNQLNELLDTQKRESGTQRVGLQRIGGYLGGAGSYQGAIVNLAQAHAQQVAALNAQKASKIQEANAAIDEKKYLLAKDIAKEVKDIEAEIQKRRDDFFQQTLQASSEQRQTDAATFNIIKDIPEGTSKTINGRTYTGIKSADMDPFFKGSDIVQLMKTIPSGTSQEIKDPNTGTVYTIQGLATEDPSIKALSSTDDRGNVILTRYNLNTGEVLSQTGLGQVGKSKTAPANTTINIRKETGALVAGITDIFMKDKGVDKKINPATYAAQQAAFLASGSGTANDFKKMFPPAEWLSTNNPDSLPFFQTSADVLDNTDSEDPFAN